jgi:hypothetical protein
MKVRNPTWNIGWDYTFDVKYHVFLPQHGCKITFGDVKNERGCENMSHATLILLKKGFPSLLLLITIEPLKANYMILRMNPD